MDSGLTRSDGAMIALAIARDSLTDWLTRYGQLEAAAGSANTFLAKGRDLGLFMSFFTGVFAGDHPDDWTRPVTQAFLNHLERDKGHKPTTVNRVLATLKHAARWIHVQRPFVAGEPTAGVVDLVVDHPEWKGLTATEVMRLRSVLEQTAATKKRANQRPLRDKAMILTLLATGLRISELLSLEVGQYEGKHFVDVKRKGKIRTRRIFLAKEAREAIDAYVGSERGAAAGPLFLAKGGGAMHRVNVDQLLKKLAAQINARLPAEEHVNLSAHKLRHTFLRKLTAEHGVEFAMEMAGHTSANYIWRYVRPSEAEKEAALEGLY